MTRRTLLVIALLFAAACGTTQPARPVVGTITYQVSGGIAGWDRTLIVDPGGAAQIKVENGPIVLTNPRPVDAGTLARLRDLVSDPKFAALDPEYLPPPGGADQQDYVITVELDGRQVQKSTRDGANRPEILDEVMATLNEILASLTAGSAIPAG
jgi:hypothetical protein